MQIRKQDIIIELGGQWIRVGLVSDKTPRKIIPAEQILTYPADIPQNQYQIRVEEMLYAIFYTHINSSCLNKTVILLEKVFTDRRILQTIAKVLFRKFKIQKLQFSLSCITPLYLTGRYSGIVISGGWSCVQIMPVYESYPLIKNFKYIPSGTQAMTKIIKDQLLLLNPDAASQVLQKITPQYLNDLKNQYSNMMQVQAKSQQTVSLNFKKNKLKLKPSSITYSNLFGVAENQQYNLAYLFLQSLNGIDLKMLQNVSNNVVFAGGMWRIKGMMQYFKKKVKQQLPKFRKLSNFNLAQKLRFVNWGFNPSEVSWIGCSVGAYIKPIDSLCLKKLQYENEGFSQKIMQNYFLSN